MNTSERDKLVGLLRDAEKLTDSLRKILYPEEELHDSTEVQEKIAKRICLTCGTQVPEGGFYLRGLHQTCYNTTMRRIREGIWKEGERIKDGKLSVGGKPGKAAVIDIAAQQSITEHAKSTADKATKRLDAKKSRKKASE